jgi:hypothetical protein
VYNKSFAEFLDQAGEPDAIVCRSADSQWMFGAVRKTSEACCTPEVDRHIRS